MREDRVSHGGMRKRSGCVLSWALFSAVLWARATVLLWMMAGLAVVLGEPSWGRTDGSAGLPNQAQDGAMNDLRVYEFSCEFWLPMGPGHLDGRIASNGSETRVAIYWIEPALYRESSFFLRYADILFARPSVYCWIYGASQVVTVNWPVTRETSLLPSQRSVEAIVQSALAVVSRIRNSREDASASLEVTAFFRGARGLTEHTYEATARRESVDDASSDVLALNTLPYGRTYAKEVRNDGVVVWREGKVFSGRPVANIMVRPIACPAGIGPAEIFGTETLGQWTLIPKPYRAYWSFDHSYLQLSDSAEGHFASQDLYDKIGCSLESDDNPPELHRALNRLRFKVALLTNKGESIHSSAQALVTAICQDDSLDAHESLLELARISGEIDQRCPEQSQEWLRPLVHQMAERVGSQAVEDLDRLMPAVTANGWFTFGTLLLDEIRIRALMKREAVETLTAKLDAIRIGASQGPLDPCEPSSSVRWYLTHLDASPSLGPIDMNSVRTILTKGLVRCYPDDVAATRSQLVEDVIQSIRLVVGEGPFRGSPEELIRSIDSFADLYHRMDKTREPMGTVLATFLCLSFCDISTQQDHELLLSQFQKQRNEAQAQVEAMLRDRGLDTLISSEDLDGALNESERMFRKYVDDPLWPPFKFPWTTTEQTQLGGKLKLRLIQLSLFLDEMSLQVKYGGNSPELKKKTMFEISHAAQQILSQAAFMRSPPCSGVQCWYRSGQGFMASIEGPLYREGNRPRDKLRIMKYFHLGHRLQDIADRQQGSVANEHGQELNP
jgi:hypothetical protein